MTTYKLLIQEPPLQVLPTLATAIGLNEAIVLQQLHYWVSKESAKSVEGKSWIYNTHEDWKKQFPFWSDKTIRRTLKSLLEKTLIESKNLNTNKFIQTKWYGINYDTLEALESALENTPKAPVDKTQTNSGTNASGQNDQLGKTRGFTVESGGSDRSGQNDQLDTVKVTNSHLVKMTTSDLVKMTNCNKEHRLPIDYQKGDARKGDLLTLIEGMLSLWNITVADKGKSVALTPNRQQALERVLAVACRDDPGAWGQYCHQIAATPFLMGKTGRSDWKVSLDWALDPENMQKILEGSYGDVAQDSGVLGAAPDTADPEIRMQEILDEIENAPDTSQWFKDVQRKMLSAVGPEKYTACLSQLKEGPTADNNVTLAAPNLFMADYIQKHYEDVLGDVFKPDSGEGRLVLIVGEKG